MDDFFHLIKNADDNLGREWLMADPKNLLLAELYVAELAARKGGKRKTYDTHAFEVNLFENLTRLRDSLWDMTYEPSRGTAHIIVNPVKREIFAAPYVDRIVHHFVVGTMYDYVDKRLCYDSYSCRVGKGTSFGIERLHHHVQAVSDNYKKPTYVIKMDISGYFMHINREILYKKMIKWLDQILPEKGKRYKITKNAIYKIIFDDPIRNVKIQGSLEDWRGLPEDKSLFWAAVQCGIVIGNLTSQFASNIYLDSLDRFVTLELGYKHYGRYVDDFYIVVTEDELPKAKRDIKVIATFLQSLGLTLNMKKTRVIPSWQGVPFLGMVVKDAQILPGKRLVRNFNRAADKFVVGKTDVDSLISYFGMLQHYDSYKVEEKIFRRLEW